MILLVMLLMTTYAIGFDYKKFPNPENKYLSGKVLDMERGIAWKVYDIEGDGKADYAIGYIPNKIVKIPRIMFNPKTNKMMYRLDFIPDLEGVKPSYYWLDLNGDGKGKSLGEISIDEYLYDQKTDGLNGNEQKALNLYKE